MDFPDRFAVTGIDFETNAPGGAVEVVTIGRRKGKSAIIEMGTFLVDTGCFGVKSAYFTEVTETKLEQFIEDTFQGRETIQKTPT